MLICIRVSWHAHGITRDLLSQSAIGRIDLAAYPSFLIPGCTVHTATRATPTAVS